MPTFCRHNRFIERCPICSKTLPGQAPRDRAPRRSAAARPSTGPARRRGARAEAVRVHREGRAEDDGYRSALVPGLRASADARRLAEELAFASGRLLGLAQEPPGLYGEIRALATEDLERATWAAVLTAYFSPLEGEDPFSGIRAALAAVPAPPGSCGSGDGETAAGGVADLTQIPLGPRSSHDPARGAATLIAYAQWAQRAGRADPQPAEPAGAPTGATGATGAQAIAFRGDAAWTATRRFERLFERLALPGFARMGRYDLLVMLGALGLYELRPDSLHLAGARGLSAEDPTTLAAKRIFGIGDPLLLERRAGALAVAASLPIEALDVALSNWGAFERATLGFPPDTFDADTLELAEEALGL